MSTSFGDLQVHNMYAYQNRDVVGLQLHDRCGSRVTGKCVGMSILANGHCTYTVLVDNKYYIECVDVDVIEVYTEKMLEGVIHV